MMQPSYRQRRGEIEHYFDRTAVKAWAALTSDAPLGRIRATVRAGREQMRNVLLSWLPADLCGQRVLDAGCGTGAFAVEMARRGAHVIAIDLSANLIELASERVSKDKDLAGGRIEFRCGDMTDSSLGTFDYTVAMDSLIHYAAHDTTKAIESLAGKTRRSILLTFAPRTPALAAMHYVGRMFPRGDRAPAIVPVEEDKLRNLIYSSSLMKAWKPGRTQRISSGFYKSQALEITKQ
jgi:magnesium-protoporphyrin O-methyltransferase